jgi:hypothetical protein
MPGKIKMAVPYNQDRPAYFEELRFAKRQQWYVAVSAIGFDAGILAALRGLQLHWILTSIVIVVVAIIAVGCLWLLWKLQNHLRATRLILNPYDLDPLPRGMEIVVALAIVVGLSTVAVIYLLLCPHLPPHVCPHTPQCPQSPPPLPQLFLPYAW